MGKYFEQPKMWNQGRMEFEPVAVTRNWSERRHLLIPGLHGRLLVPVPAWRRTIWRWHGGRIDGRHQLQLWLHRRLWWAYLHWHIILNTIHSISIKAKRSFESLLINHVLWPHIIKWPKKTEEKRSICFLAWIGCISHKAGWVYTYWHIEGV